METRRFVVPTLLALVLSACGGSPVGSASSGSPARVASAAPTNAPPTAEPWMPADIAQPAAVLDAPTLQPGYQCHPCHVLAENEFLGAGRSADGTIAVGLQQPPAHAIAFVSRDGRRWIPLPGFNAADGTAALAVASVASRTVIVGHDAAGAMSWASTGDGWTAAPPQADLHVPYAAGGMTSVTAFQGGFVAGGYHDDPLHLVASAAVWRSSDGLSWHADDGSGTFAGGRIWGLAASAGVLVAVGTNGDPNYGPAAAWRWTQGSGWQRARLSPDAGGAMRAVAATASGFVAVGLDGSDHGARVWTSVDGSDWTVMPDQPALHFGDAPVRMQSVAATSAGLVAGGWRSDAGKGSAVTWTSPDGRTWTSTWEPSFSGGQVDAVTAVDGTVVAAGRTGYPDWNTAAVWLGPSP